MNFSRREKILGIITGGCLLAVMAGQFGWDLVNRGFDALDRDAVSLTEKIRKSQVVLSRQERAEAEFRQALDVLGEQEDDQNLMTKMLAAINAMAQAKNVHLQELNSLPLEKEEGRRTLRIRVSLSAAWPSLLEFFNELQKSPHRFDMEDVVLETSQTADGTVRCQITLSRWSLLEDPA
jgi:hypothetical protein